MSAEANKRMIDLEEISEGESRGLLGIVAQNGYTAFPWSKNERSQRVG